MTRRERAFRGKVALIVGASSGIGRELGCALARAGAHVTFAARRGEVLRAAVDEVRASGGEAEACTVDVTRRDDVLRLVTRVHERAGRIDYMFNNAGIGQLGYARDMSAEDWKRIIDVNMMGVLHGVQAVYPLMVEQGGGHIVNTSSLAGLLPIPASAGYVMTKHAVVGLSHALRLEGQEHGVRVSVVCPAAVKTPIFDVADYVNIDGRRAMEAAPGGALTAAECIDAIIAGVMRNQATITPGAAGVMWRVNRLFPWLWELAARSMNAKLAPFRQRQTNLTSDAPSASASDRSSRSA